MKITDKISSLKNSRIVNFIHLQKSRERKKQDVFILEGVKEIEKARQAAYNFKEVYFCPDITSEEELQRLIGTTNADVFEVSRQVYDKIAYRESTGGVVILAQPKSHLLKELSPSKNPFVLVVESVEKPGNLGAILRTADAAGVDALIVCDPLADVYNSNVIRSSLGCVFTVPLAISDTVSTIEWLKGQSINIVVTYLEAAHPYYECNFKQAVAIVMGTESTGISEKWVQAANERIIIPMHGIVDSLNVSTATAVTLFEARRQRELYASIKK